MTRQERRAEARAMAKRFFHGQMAHILPKSIWQAFRLAWLSYRLKRVVAVSRVPWFQLVESRPPRTITSLM